MRKIAIIGCGGINSWFVENLNVVLHQFLDKENKPYVKIFDEDILKSVHNATFGF